jgi:hypothetical protein
MVLHGAVLRKVGAQMVPSAAVILASTGEVGAPSPVARMLQSNN